MNDVFRSRKQNTSRPPSMHVDDFMAMENAKTQDSPPMRRPGTKVCFEMRCDVTVFIEWSLINKLRSFV